MLEVAKLSPKLSDEQRNLLSESYKNIVGARRSSYRVVKSIMEKETDALEQRCCAQIAKTISKEIVTVCNELSTLISTKLLKADSTIKAQV